MSHVDWVAAFASDLAMYRSKGFPLDEACARAATLIQRKALARLGRHPYQEKAQP